MEPVFLWSSDIVDGDGFADSLAAILGRREAMLCIPRCRRPNPEAFKGTVGCAA